MQAAKRIAVAGATGRAGRHAVDVLRERGHDVVPISRSNGVDVITGDGLAEALEGVGAVIDVATGPSPEQEAATEFFTTAARNLQRVGESAGVERIVGASIIGADKFSGGYGLAQLAHEMALKAGPVPARVLRAAQFHEFVAQLMDWGMKDGVTYVPRMRTQLVAARTVAEALADLATEPDPAPSDAPFSEVAGPREESLVEVAALLASRRGEPERVELEGEPEDPDSVLMEDGSLLPGPEATLAGPTFEEWLDSESA